MNLKDRLQIELSRQDNELLREALEYIEITGADSEALGRLHEALDYYDLPLEYDALSKALERLRADHTALIDRYDALNDDYEALIDLQAAA
jgi:DNA-binding LytR/AlgR family response regulator